MTNPIRRACETTPECPSLESLAQRHREPALRNHVETCAHCRTELALLSAFEQADAKPHERPPVQWIEGELRRRFSTPPFAAAPSRWSRLVAAIGRFADGGYRTLALGAASLLIAIAAGVYLRPQAALQNSALSEEVILRSAAFAAIAPAGDVAAPPTEFRWQTAPGAARYEVQLVEVDRTVIWSGETTLTQIEIPSDVRAQLKPGRTFQWKVLSRNSAGEQTGSSNLQIFHTVVTTR